jgi:hypothetical protein
VQRWLNSSIVKVDDGQRGENEGCQSIDLFVRQRGMNAKTAKRIEHETVHVRPGAAGMTWRGCIPRRVQKLHVEVRELPTRHRWKCDAADLFLSGSTNKNTLARLVL